MPANVRLCPPVPPQNLHGKEGSTVRVRQRACKKSPLTGFFVPEDLLLTHRAVGMEPFMER